MLCPMAGHQPSAGTFCLFLVLAQRHLRLRNPPGAERGWIAPGGWHLQVIDPANSLNGVLDVAVAGNTIAEVGPGLTSIYPDAEVFDATGKYVTPGLVDLHVHVYEVRTACIAPQRTALAPAGQSSHMERGGPDTNLLPLLSSSNLFSSGMHPDLCRPRRSVPVTRGHHRGRRRQLRGLYLPGSQEIHHAALKVRAGERAGAFALVLFPPLSLRPMASPRTPLPRCMSLQVPSARVSQRGARGAGLGRDGRQLPGWRTRQHGPGGGATADQVRGREPRSRYVCPEGSMWVIIPGL